MRLRKQLLAVLCTLRTSMRGYAGAYLRADDHVLVYWPEEDCVSVVAFSSIAGSSPPTIAQVCKVRIGKKEHKGVTMEIGT